MRRGGADEPSTILLVDDSIVELRLLVDLLAGLDLRVHVAFNGLDGHAKAELIRPSLILLDVSMPGLDGLGVCRRLKASPRTRDIPVLFLSAATELESRLAGFEAGAVDYITKPFSAEEVLARVQVHLDIARRLHSAKPAPGSAPQRPQWPGLSQRDATLLDSAIAVLRDNLANPPSPEALARGLGTNEKRLNAAFQSAFALPVYGWLREERLQQARTLVTAADSSLADIAEHLGYSNQANFARAFSQRFGIAPSRLRAEALTTIPDMAIEQ